MDLIKMIGELRSQQHRIEQAIVLLERLAGRQGRRGRPPAFLAELTLAEATVSKPKKRRIISAEARERMASAQRRRWAAYRAEQKSTGT